MKIVLILKRDREETSSCLYFQGNILLAFSHITYSCMSRAGRWLTWPPVKNIPGRVLVTFLHHTLLEPVHELISTQLLSHTRARKNLSLTDRQSSILLALYRTNQSSFVQHVQNGLFLERRVKFRVRASSLK